MATKDARGTKRTCQNSECGSRFYDLNRAPITCPICGESYVIASAPIAAVDPSRLVRKPEPVREEVAETELPEVEGTVSMEDIAEEEEALADDADDTFIAEEEEEDGGDVSGIIGGPVAEGEEEI